jgi:hypothetical protein
MPVTLMVIYLGRTSIVTYDDAQEATRDFITLRNSGFTVILK